MSASGSPFPLNTRIEPAVALKFRVRSGRAIVCLVVESGGNRWSVAAGFWAGPSASAAARGAGLPAAAAGRSRGEPLSVLWANCRPDRSSVSALPLGCCGNAGAGAAIRKAVIVSHVRRQILTSGDINSLQRRAAPAVAILFCWRGRKSTVNCVAINKLSSAEADWLILQISEPLDAGLAKPAKTLLSFRDA